MLSFLNLWTQSRILRFTFFKKSSPIKINGSVDYAHLRAQNYCFIQFKLCSTLSEREEMIPLEEISNLTLSHKNFNAEKLSLLTYEISKYKVLKRNLPEYIKLSDVCDILDCETKTQRLKYLTYLFKKEKIKLKNKKINLMNKMEKENKVVKDLESNKHIQYGLGKNTLFLRTFRRSIINFYDKRLANAALFGQKMVIDLGYDELMIKREKRACSSQIRLLYSINKFNRNPYDLFICNASSESRCVQLLREEMPNIDESLTTLTEQSYLDIFPKKDLVYLSPHASETLTTYDHKAVYIIGGFVDTVKREIVSSFKAQEEGIKSYRLPLDEYVAWGIGSKSLTINQVFSILQTKRDTDDWNEAFKHLPTRKLKKVDINSDNAELHSDKSYVISNN